MLAKVFPPELVDRVVDEAGSGAAQRTLPARVVVYLLLAMVLFFQSGYGEVWNKLVAGLEWARQFRVRVRRDAALARRGDPGAAAAGLAGDGAAAGGGAGPLAGRSR